MRECCIIKGANIPIYQNAWSILTCGYRTHPFPLQDSPSQSPTLLNLTTFVLAFTRFFTLAGQLALCMPTSPGNGQKQEVGSAVDEWVCTMGASNPNNVRGAVQWRRFIFPAIHAISHAPLLCSFWHARILKAATRPQSRDEDASWPATRPPFSHTLRDNKGLPFHRQFLKCNLLLVRQV
jgi:hypothetical protein